MEIAKFSKSHEWTKKDGDLVVIGITEYAAKELGDVVFVELPKVGDKIRLDKSFGIVESVKSVSDLISPLTGEIVEINSSLDARPELVNEDPLGKGWMIKIKIENAKEYNELLTENEYKKFIEEE